MRNAFRALLLTAALLPPMAATGAEVDPRVADIVRAGQIRIGLHLPQFVTDPMTGEIRGNGTGTVIVQVARALAQQLGVDLKLIGHPSPPALVECLRAEACDAGFLGFLPNRTGEVGFTAPYIQVPFTFMVPPASELRSAAEVDKVGLRIAAVRSHASTQTLARLLTRAEMTVVEIPDEAFDLIRSGRADAWAAPRPPLLEYLAALPGARVLNDHYGANLQSMAVPKSRPARLDYISEFVEKAKVSGLVQQAIERAGERGIEVAPLGDAILTGSVPAARAP